MQSRHNDQKTPPLLPKSPPQFPPELDVVALPNFGDEINDEVDDEINDGIN